MLRTNPLHSSAQRKAMMSVMEIVQTDVQNGRLGTIVELLSSRGACPPLQLAPHIEAALAIVCDVSIDVVPRFGELRNRNRLRFSQ
jgi:hypothetical protein